MVKRAKAGARLYAWARPLRGLAGNPDHTWVSTFDCRVGKWPSIDEVERANEFYWYCWGDYHPNCRAKGDLAAGPANIALAKCLVTANVPSKSGAGAEGSIFRYGFHGVCHQLANQVLYATAAPRTSPLTVSAAKGYFASTFLYGTYGTEPAAKAFLDKLRNCGSGTEKKRTSKAMSDEFEKHAREVLADDAPEKLTALLALRKKAQAPNVRDAAADAAALNAKNRAMLDQAAKVLGAKHFRAVFGFPPSQPMDFVDPDQMPTVDKSAGSKSQILAAPTVTLKDLATAIAESHHMGKKEAETILHDLVGSVVKHLKKGERIRLAGLGILQVRKHASRMGRNPATGESIKIKASRKVAFRAAKELKQKIG